MSKTMLLKNVIISFPHVYKPQDYQGDGKFKYQATFLLDPKHPDKKKIEDAISKMAAEKWGAKAESILTALKAKEDCYALRDGNLRADSAGYAGNYFIKAANKAKPSVFNRDRTLLPEESGKIYSGAIVNAEVEIYLQDNPKFGKRVVVRLLGVQFVKDGEAFAGAPPSEADDFEDLSAEDDSDLNDLIGV